MNMTLNIALQYLRSGFSVIPLKPKTKQAMVKWEPYQERRATEDEVKTWFSSGEANVGLVTGKLSNLVVIDADGQLGISELSKLRIYSPVVVFTGQGKHLWFKNPTIDVRNSVKKIAPNVDIRGEGGYVVAPPSLHENGKRYRFLNTVGVAGLKNQLPNFPLAVFSAGTVSVPAITTSQPKPANWVLEALEEMKNGHVHNTLISVLGKFRYHNFSIDDTYELLRPHALVNGQPYEELRDKIEEFWGRYPAGDSRINTSRAFTPIFSGQEPRSIESFLETEVKTEWLCKPFFSKQSLGFIVGLPEALKSWLAMDLAIELANGGNWLGRYETTKSRVLYIDQERALPETQRRFKSLLSDKGITKKELSDSLFVDCSSHRKMDLDISFESFKREVAKIRPDIIIVDSFVTFHTKPENDRMEVQKVLDRLKAIREEFGCSFVFIDHESKNAYQDATEHNEPSAGRMVGSIGKIAAAESILTVKKITPGSSNVYQTKNSLATPAKEFTVNITDTQKGIRLSI